MLAAVRSAGAAAGIEQVETLMRSAEIDAAAGFEVLVEADGHSRTDLGIRVVGAYALGKGDAATPPATTLTTQSNGENVAPSALSAAEC